ncbi:DMT family transporter [Paracoccus sp. p4-l81]|uniref:DMT family transporter n=1 Tax=unclassified Paracoccus (in: a-proteobacteria) TaxID=2688777 RepID=UPI0035B9FF1E
MTYSEQSSRAAVSGPAQGAALMVAAGALFAVVNTLLQWVTMRAGLNSASVTLWQYGVALICTLPWLILRPQGSLRTRRPLAHLSRVALAVGGVQLWTAGLAQVPIWQAIALIMLSPMFVTLGAVALLGERVSLLRLLALIVGFAGGMVVLAPWSEAFTAFALLPVGAAAMWAGTSLMTKYLSRDEPPETLTLWLLALLVPANAVLALPFGVVPAGPGLALPAVAAAGVLTALAQYLLARAYARHDAGYLQPFDYLKLPLNVALGIAAFGFVPPGSLWIGAAMIVAASVTLVRLERAP